MAKSLFEFKLQEYLAAYYGTNLNWQFASKQTMVTAEEFFDTEGFLPVFAQVAKHTQSSTGIQCFDAINIDKSSNSLLGSKVEIIPTEDKTQLHTLALMVILHSIEDVCGNAVPDRRIDVDTIRQFFHDPTLENQSKLPCNM
jgi:hypothetical protein